MPVARETTSAMSSGVTSGARWRAFRLPSSSPWRDSIWSRRLPARARVVVLRLHPQANARAGLVDQVDRLVGQEAVADVAIGELRGRDDRLVGDSYTVE